MKNNTTPPQRITVLQQDKGKRLDTYLASVLTECSRSRIQQLIKSGAVLLNKKPPTSHSRLKTNDLVEVQIPKPVPLHLRPEPLALDILYEDEYLLVINKTPDIIVHPVPGVISGTLVNGLLHHCKDLSGINGILRPGIVHRLDKHTSGCLIISKTDRAHLHLAAQFRQRKIEKHYRAICWGTPSRKEGTIETLIGRDRVHRKKMTTAVYKGKEAISTYSLLTDMEIASLVDVRIITGRTHQIRVHMSSLSHPLVGDREYGGGTAIIGQLKKSHQLHARHCLKIISRQALHAWSITFSHPISEKKITCRAELPADFRSLYNYLKRVKKEWSNGNEK